MVSVRLGLGLGLFRFTFCIIYCFYQAYCILIMRYYITLQEVIE